MNNAQRKSLEAAIQAYQDGSPGHNTPSGAVLEWLREIAKENDIMAFSEGCAQIQQNCSINWPFICQKVPAFLANYFFTEKLSLEEYTRFEKIYDGVMAQKIRDCVTIPTKLSALIENILVRCRS